MGELLVDSLLVGLVWLIHFTFAILLASPFLLFGNHRPHWNGLDLLALFLPFSLWAICMLAYQGTDSVEKVSESLLISALIAVAAAIRVTVGHVRTERLVSTLLLVCLCVFALAIYVLTPPLPVF